MADTAFRSDSNLTVIKWSAALYREAMKNLYFGKLVGTGSNAIIERKTDLTKDVGDQIRFGLRMRLTGQGRSDDQALEGYEEALTFHDFSTKVHLRANAVRAAGKMSMRRTKFDIRSEARSALADWLREMIDDDTVLALSGLANPAIVDDDGAVESAVSPSTNRKWYGGQNASGSIADDSGYDLGDSGIADGGTSEISSYLFGTAVISLIKRKAQLATPKIRPAVVDGKEVYVMLIHPYQAKALKAETAWKEAQQYAQVRGSKNPLFTGALGMWDGVVIHEYERILTRTGDGTGTDPSTYFESDDPCAQNITVARALFLGAQAGVHAYAQMPGWYEKNFEYGRVPGVATDIIYRAAKTRFNSEDFGVITVDTAVATD